MPLKRSGLGRGLEALIPGEEREVSEEPEFALIPIESIRPSADQPRRRFDDSSLEELAASMSEVGVLQPVVVRSGDEGYVLIAGERRWRAAKRAGLGAIPAVIREVHGDSTLVESLVENLQRLDLTPIEEAKAFRELLENHGMTQEQVAERVGKSRPTISNTLRLLQLPEKVQELVDSGDLSAGHARALVGVADDKYAVYLAERAIADDWSVRQIEEAVRVRRGMPEATGKGRKLRHLRPVEIIELEKRLAERLGTRVRIDYRNERGKVEIRFGSLEELERLYRTLAD